MKDQQKIWIIIAIFALAFAVRLINLQIMKGNPFFDYPVMDEKYHDEWAQEIGQGNLFGRTPFYRAPFYPLFLGAVYAIFGHNYFLARMISVLLGSINCILIYLLGSILFDRRIGLLSAIFASFYSMFLFFDSMLLTVGMEIFLSLFSIYLLLRWFERRRILDLGLSGLVLGLATITRPNFFVFFLVAIFYLLIRGIKAGRKIGLAQILLYVILFFTPIVTVTTVNIVKGHDLVPIAWNGGINFYLGNNPNASGWSATAPGIDATWWGGYRDAIILAEQDLGRNLLPSQVSNYWFNKGLGYLTSDPIGWTQILIKKVYLLMNNLELKNNLSIKTVQTFSFLLRIPVLNFGFIISLSLIGLVLFRMDRRSRILLTYLVAYAITVIAFFVTARYRMIIIPFLIIMAPATIVSIIKSFKKKDISTLIKVFIVLPLLLIFVNSDFYNTKIFHQVDRSLIYGTYGNRYFQAKDFPEALYYYRLSLKEDPKNTNAANGIGNCYLAMKDLAKAKEHYLSSLEIKENADALSKLGALYLSIGDLDSAAIFLDRALKIASTNPEVHYYLGLYHAYRSEKTAAAVELEKALQLFPDPRYVNNIYQILSRLYYEMDDLNKARWYQMKIKR
ncbi:MAG TPA: tetratricopeptide repeat protein [bacterium (Candidatus Stahlbacteria)]|nr:tetratricopeptide repeat protein [Candidatus Stahlbacteria bacterium]